MIPHLIKREGMMLGQGGHMAWEYGLRVVLDERIGVDVVTFERAYATVKGEAGLHPGRGIRQLEAAVHLWRSAGDLL